MSEPISRRDILKGTAVAGVLAFLSAVGCENISNDPEVIENSLIKLGRESKGDPFRVDLEKNRILYTPDGHIPFVKVKGETRAFISGNAASYLVKTKRGDTSNFEVFGADIGLPFPVVGPDKNVPYRNGYAALTSVLQLDPNNPNELVGISHCEKWKNTGGQLTGENFTASIGFQRSSDGGINWTSDPNPFLHASDQLEPGQKVSGVGQPCAVIKEEGGKKYFYMYYVHWQPRGGADQIYLSRSEINGVTLGKLEHFTKDGFKNTQVAPGMIEPVVTPNFLEGANYAALPSVSFNEHLKKYLMVFETQVGFCATTSSDGISWKQPELVFKFQKPQNPHTDGQVWYSYPTLLSGFLDNDRQTAKTGTFIYSKGKWGEGPHTMVTRPFELK
jgi:hypothetical protein